MSVLKIQIIWNPLVILQVKTMPWNYSQESHQGMVSLGFLLYGFSPGYKLKTNGLAKLNSLLNRRISVVQC